MVWAGKEDVELCEIVVVIVGGEEIVGWEILGMKGGVVCGQPAETSCVLDAISVAQAGRR